MIAIQGQAERLPHPQVLHGLCPNRIRVTGQVDEDFTQRGMLCLQSGLVAVSFVLLVERNALRVHGAACQVHVAGDDLKRRSLHVGHDGNFHFVDVGQLVAGLVHLEVVGIAGHGRPRRSHAGEQVGGHVGQSGFVLPVLVHLGTKQTPPFAFLESRLRDHRIEGVHVGIVAMELLQEAAVRNER